MNRKEFTVAVFKLVFSLIIFFGTLVNVIIMNIDPSKSNTTEFTATVKSVKIVGEGARDYCVIYSKEYGNKIITDNVREISDISDFTGLKEGQLVFFRVENIWLDQSGKIKEMDFIPIVSIRTAEKEIVSLSDYNEYRDNMRLPPTLAAIVVALIFLFISIRCISRLKEAFLFRKKMRLKDLKDKKE